LQELQKRYDFDLKIEFSEEVLRWMNRAHNATEAHRILERLRKRDFSLTTDLIYALPEPYADFWEEDLQILLDYRPEHISAYTLTFEEKTAFYRQLERGKVSLPDDEKTSVQFLSLSNQLQATGYEHYEISSFARNGLYARHNTAYWFQKPYLGVGPSAHSYAGGRRWANVASNFRYVQKVQARNLPNEEEVLSRNDQINEFVLTRLRTQWGLSLQELQKRYDFDLKIEFSEELLRVKEQTLIEERDQTLFLTPKGKLMADEVAAIFFV
ncbi:MAG: coproporphyrinogen III oxidase, partial [Bacteroidota bacterium]